MGIKQRLIGKHDSARSVEIFLQVNETLDNRSTAWQVK